jgi:HK97 family phage major capsid protein
MSDVNIAPALDAHFKAVEAAVQRYEGQVKDAGSAANEARDAVKVLSAEFKAKLDEINAVVTDVAQKSAAAPRGADKPQTLGNAFVNSPEFKSLVASDNRNAIARVELKNTIVADNTTTTWLDQRPGVVPGAFRPLTVRDVLPQFRTSTDTVVLMREASFTNNAREVTEAAAKPESAITFNKLNVPIETIATWLKVSKQLMADAPAVADYIDTRLRFMVEDRIDGQLLNGNGTSPNISGLLDSGNYTVYTPTSGDNLINAINRAKYQLWAIGYMADAVIVNPADWGAQEIEQASDGQYLYGQPGLTSGLNPFGIRVVISNKMAPGSFLVGAFAQAAGVWNREGTVVEAGYSGTDFTSNLITLRAESRLGLAVQVPAALLGGEFTA